MRIVFFTRDGFDDDPLFQYIYAHVADAFPDSHILAVRQASRTGFRSKLKRLRRIVRNRGLIGTLEMASSKPLQRLIGRRDARELSARLSALPRPAAGPPASRTCVGTINGRDAIQSIASLEPDVILQTGAGILRPQIFALAKIATINMHHGIAPLIRGVNSIYWALYERNPAWIGATVHRIDSGIDTGAVLAYAPLPERAAGEGFPSLFARATQAGTSQLIVVLKRFAAGERWTEPVFTGPSEYRSSMSGWKLALVKLRLWRELGHSRKIPPSPRTGYSSVKSHTR